MKKLLVLHGPNLNLLGVREPEVYGRETLADLDRETNRVGAELGLDVDAFQSNHEGELIDQIHAAKGVYDGIILNPGGLTHTSVSLRDAVSGVDVPVIEVHLSNTFAREEFRSKDLIAPVAHGTIVGLGQASYLAAVYAFSRLLDEG